ncbi:MAG: hypothetical protein IT371_24475 [Deltaproteobacteria bacterium]|nr:hypothetical protein [Deltaproteobacteria bacterium]
MRRIATLFIASILAACAGDGGTDPQGGGLEHSATTVDERGMEVNTSCTIYTGDQAKGYTALADNLSDGAFINDEESLVVNYRFGSMRTYCSGEGAGVQTRWFTLKVTEPDFPLRVRLLNGQNVQVIVWQKTGATWTPTWEHKGGLAASDESQASDDAINKATLKVGLPVGEYAITVTLKSPPFFKWTGGWLGIGSTLRPAVDTIPYKVAIMKGTRPGQCGSPEVPDEFVIEETTQWDKIWSDFDMTFPEFNIRGLSSAGGQYIGKFKRDFFNWALGGTANLAGNARIIGWKNMAGDTVAYTRKTSPKDALTHVDVLDCNEPPQIIGAHDEPKKIGSGASYYILTDYTTGQSVDSWRFVGTKKNAQGQDEIVQADGGLPAFVFQLFDSKTKELLVTITQQRRTMADLYYVKKEPAMKMADPANPGKFIDKVNARIWANIPASFTVSSNQKLHQCFQDSYDKKKVPYGEYGGVNGATPDDCSDCCLDARGGQSRLEKRTHTETEEGPCNSWDDQGNCNGHSTIYHSWDWNACLCR